MSKILRAWCKFGEEPEDVLTGMRQTSNPSVLTAPRVMTVYTDDGRALFECTVPVEGPVGTKFIGVWNGEKWKFLNP